MVFLPTLLPDTLLSVEAFPPLLHVPLLLLLLHAAEAIVDT
jgi:hypothetical protein